MFAFVLMPFDPAFDDIYRLGIKETAEKLGIRAERVDEQIFHKENILERIYGQIDAADLIIADLTGRNPVLAYQEGFVAAIEAGDGLAAALHTPAWARLHLEDSRLLLLYSRHDFVGDWPATLKRGVRDQAQRFEACLASFARHAFGRLGPAQLRRAAFVLVEVPIAAIRPHLEHREPPPALVDELITATYHAIIQGKRQPSG